MDFSPLFQPLLGALWYLIPLFVLVAVIKSPWFKGQVGEAIVNLSAHFLLDRKTYHLIRNVTLPTEDGTTQIDHLIVSPFGVFVAGSTFKMPMPDNVTKGLGFIWFIKSHTKSEFTNGKVQTLVEEITIGRENPTWRTHREYVRHVQHYEAETG